jgi:hypothetical protein
MPPKHEEWLAMSARDDWVRARRARLSGNGLWQVKARQRDAQRRRLADRLLAAVRARGTAFRKAEQRAGEIVVRLVDEQGVSLHQVVDWCDGAVTFAAVARMRRAPQSRETPHASADGG